MRLDHALSGGTDASASIPGLHGEEHSPSNDHPSNDATNHVVHQRMDLEATKVVVLNGDNPQRCVAFKVCAKAYKPHIAMALLLALVLCLLV